MRRVILLTVILCGLALAASPLQEAQQLYHHSNYQGVLKLLLPVPNKDAQTWALVGQAYFMSTDYKQATDAFEKATALEPRNSEYVHWLGKAWGRRAESSSMFMAPAYASKARQMFERAVMLDTSNIEALNDLFDYYLEAPGFLGGGLNRAEALVQRISALNEAEGHYAMAQLLDRRKEFAAAEQQLRRAFELAPRQVGRSIDLARYLSKLGRVDESEAAFAQAERITPNNPRILYERARTYIRDNRNLAQARELLKQYLNAPLTPNDPPRYEAEQLLRKAGA
jgi:cytochrome c-type biogenesis protein CcmH/NrfG